MVLCIFCIHYLLQLVSDGQLSLLQGDGVTHGTLSTLSPTGGGAGGSNISQLSGFMLTSILLFGHTGGLHATCGTGGNPLTGTLFQNCFAGSVSRSQEIGRAFKICSTGVFCCNAGTGCNREGEVPLTHSAVLMSVVTGGGTGRSLIDTGYGVMTVRLCNLLFTLSTILSGCTGSLCARGMATICVQLRNFCLLLDSLTAETTYLTISQAGLITFCRIAIGDIFNFMLAFNLSKVRCNLVVTGIGGHNRSSAAKLTQVRTGGCCVLNHNCICGSAGYSSSCSNFQDRGALNVYIVSNQASVSTSTLTLGIIYVDGKNTICNEQITIFRSCSTTGITFSHNEAHTTIRINGHGRIDNPSRSSTINISTTIVLSRTSHDGAPDYVTIRLIACNSQITIFNGKEGFNRIDSTVLTCGISCNIDCTANKLQLSATDLSGFSGHSNNISGI